MRAPWLAVSTQALFLALSFGCASPRDSALVAPKPISPVAGASFDHFPRTTLLNWSPVSGAISYSVEVDCFHCCDVGKWCSEVGKPEIAASGITSTDYKFGWVGANLGRWRVWAVTPDGKESQKSPWQEFLYTR